MNWRFVILILSIVIKCALAAPNKVVCYYNTETVSRPDGGRLDIEDIDLTLCTHLIYGYVGIDSVDGTVVVINPTFDLDQGGFYRFTALKERNAGLVTLLGFGGPNVRSYNFSSIAHKADMRDIFATNAASFAQQYGFDGIDIAWEYPAQRGGAGYDWTYHVEFLWALRAQLEPRGLLLTESPKSAVEDTGYSYDVARMADVLDWINFKTFDMHGYDINGNWQPVTGSSAPLYPKASATDQRIALDRCVQNWINLGFPREKINLGIVTYGHTWRLTDLSQTGVQSPANGQGDPGPYLNTAGTLGYNELCQQWWNYGWDDEELSVYAWRDDQWLGFENVDTVAIRTQYDQNLGGLYIHTIDTDDTFALCGSYYPITRSVRSTLGWN